ncbi:ABC transporter ATP-binding protein, partial [Jiangella asiatica]
MTESTEPLLVIDDLAVEFRTDEGVVRAVDGAAFSVGTGEIVGVVGES